MRKGRFPLVSVIILAGLILSVWYMAQLDVDTPRNALRHVGQAISKLVGSVGVMTASTEEDPGIILTDSSYLQRADEETFFSVEATPRPSLPLLVNEKHPLPEGYAPAALVRMRDYCDAQVVTIKGSEIQGEQVAVDALMAMLRAAIAQGVGNWQVSAGYRSIAYQQQLWDNRVYEFRQQGLSGSQAQSATAKQVAKPGASEHHTGLAFDITVPGESFALTPQCRWLHENCWDYGFIIRYTEEKEGITGIIAEPWHIRYVGVPHATAMRDNGWCLEEYINSFQGLY